MTLRWLDTHKIWPDANYNKCKCWDWCWHLIYTLKKYDPHPRDTYAQGFGKNLWMAFRVCRRRQRMMLEAMEAMIGDCVQLSYWCPYRWVHYCFVVYMFYLFSIFLVTFGLKQDLKSWYMYWSSVFGIRIRNISHFVLVILQYRYHLARIGSYQHYQHWVKILVGSSISNLGLKNIVVENCASQLGSCKDPALHVLIYVLVLVRSIVRSFLSQWNSLFMVLIVLVLSYKINSLWYFWQGFQTGPQWAESPNSLLIF